MKKRITKLISSLVKINSVYPNERKIGRFVYDYFRKLKYNPHKQKVDNGRYNIIVEKGLGNRTLILYSHLDTVNVVSGWKTNPFDLNVKGDRAYGLGAWDMKGGTAINILNFINYQPKNFKLKIIFCVDEENNSKGASIFSKSKQLKNAACILSTEPAFQNGLRGIVTGRIGRAVYEIKISAESKHTAFYKKNYDINYFASQILLSINKLNKESDGKKQYFFARKLESSSIGMSLPEKTLIVLESGILPPLKHSDALKELKKIVASLNKKNENYYSAEVSFVKRDVPYLDSYQIDLEDKFLLFLSKSIKKILNKKAIPYFRASVADENIFGALGKTVLGIGPVGENAHAPNEWVSLSSLENLYNIINDFLITVDKFYDLGRPRS